MKKCLYLSLFASFLFFQSTAFSQSPNNLFSGDYLSFYYMSSPFAGYSYITCDGNGTYVSDENEPGVFDFAISDSLGLTLHEMVDGNPYTWQGHLSENGCRFNGVIVDLENACGMFTGIKCATGKSNADVHDQYAFSYYSNNGAVFAGLFLVTFDGAETCWYEPINTAAEVESDSLKYQVNDDGSIIASFLEGDTMGVGVLAEDGTIAFSARYPAFGYGIPLTTGFTVDNIPNAFGVTMIQGENQEDSTHEKATIMNLTLYQDGSGFYQTMFSTDNDMDSGDFTYQSSENGLFEVYITGTDQVIISGIFDPSGQQFTAYQRLSDNNHSMMVGIAKPEKQPTSAENNNRELPSSMMIVNNYPNPFNRSTTIHYSIPVSGNVQLQIYDLNGRFVDTVVNAYSTAGSYNTNWEAPYALSSGLYFIKLQTQSGVNVGKLLYQK
ncbi:T9SS type A sorting domain-containing protein [candidate division KSB1 bacterium]|nr:T9SS type A sorting domain-containing protein [candidate division KSB1 bacterium]